MPEEKVAWLPGRHVGHVAVHPDLVKAGNGCACLLYTSDAADERSSVDLGGRRIIKKKTHTNTVWAIALLNIYAHEELDTT